MPRKLGLAVLLLLAVTAHAETDTHEYKLDNGMKLIVREDHRAPVVISQVWYKIGANYEHDGITGVSHVLEHMMFKGTQAHPSGEFSRIIAENGGRENAFTGRDYTAYFQQLEKSRLPVSFELEADRMRNLLLPPEEFAKEIKVVMEERRLRTEDDPQSLTYEQFLATAFLNSPNRIPVIGWMDDLENLRVDGRAATGTGSGIRPTTPPWWWSAMCSPMLYMNSPNATSDRSRRKRCRRTSRAKRCRNWVSGASP